VVKIESGAASLLQFFECIFDGRAFVGQIRVAKILNDNFFCPQTPQHFIALQSRAVRSRRRI
jgi:hypothetical protein